MSFSIDHYTIAEACLTGIHGNKGLGHYRLRPILQVSLNPRPEGKPLWITDISGKVEMSVPGNGLQHRIGSLSPTALGAARAFPTQSSTALPYSCSVDAEIELDDKRISAMEDLRLGGDFQLTISMQARFLDQAGITHMSGDNQTLLVNQATWLRVLTEMGYGRYMLIEVPVPDQAADPEMAKTVECLAKANVALRRGEWREAVGTCRDVLEALGVAMNDGDKTDPMFNPLFANSQNADMNARLLVLRRALKLFTHPARHMSANSVGHDWRRSDAIAIISMVSALIQKLNEPKP